MSAAGNTKPRKTPFHILHILACILDAALNAFVFSCFRGPVRDTPPRICYGAAGRMELVVTEARLRRDD
jgi:hypothetical protein